MSQTKEIERKFLLSKLPTVLPELKHHTIYQQYLQTYPIELRLTTYPDTDKQPRLTVKSKGDLVRTEVTHLLSSEQVEAYQGLLNVPIDFRIEKDYHQYDLGNGLILEVSNVDDDFIYAEVEFESEEQANAFDENVIPNLLSEVTGDSTYKMASYWERKCYAAALTKQPKWEVS